MNETTDMFTTTQHDLEESAPTQQWGVRRGDVWLIGGHRLMCGDSTCPDDASALMDGETAHLVHADPPYGMGKTKDGVVNDNLYRGKLDAFQMDWWQTFRTHLADNASAYIWGNAPDLWRLWYVGGLRDSERLTFRNCIVWDKYVGNVKPTKIKMMRSYVVYREDCLFFMIGEQGFNNNADNYWEGWEPIRKYLDTERKKVGWSNKTVASFFGFHPRMASHWFSQSQWSMPTADQYQRLQAEAKGNAFKRDYDELKRDYDELKREFYATRAHFDNTHDNMTDVWQFSRVVGDERHGHATPKPTKMVARCLKSSLPEGGLCVVPFVGSGSAMVAAQMTKRRAYGMEITPEYCETTLNRMHKLFPDLNITRARRGKRKTQKYKNNG